MNFKEAFQRKNNIPGRAIEYEKNMEYGYMWKNLGFLDNNLISLTVHMKLFHYFLLINK